MLKRILFSLLIIFLFVTPVSGVGYFGNGVDDLRGRWDVDLFIGEEEHIEVSWLIQDIEVHPDQENTFIAAGCMKTIASKKYAPLSMMANYIPENNKYDILIYSTVIPVEGEPIVIRFDGEVYVHGSGVKDDESQGNHISDRGEGPWVADHHDRRRPHCSETLDPSLQFTADVYTHQDLAPIAPHFTKLYEAYTRIVSSGMIVDTPDGETVHVFPYTDLFSPFVDFVSEFRYLSNLEGPPISGEVYTFTLLDILGNPIAGATTEDIWTGCRQGAPVNIQLEDTTAEDVLMEWDNVAVEDGWDPVGGIGFYQLGISPMFESETSYGASGIATNTHWIPWAPFGESAPGDPDGDDYGKSISELDDGEYEVGIGAYAVAPDGSGGHGLECAVYDSSEFYMMNKISDALNFTRRGTISGTVYDESGTTPLSNIAVDIEEGGYGTCTDEKGNYRMFGMQPGTYNVVAGRDFCDPHDYIEGTIEGIELTGDVPDVSGVDFYLKIGGSIAGTVKDTQGDPIIGVHVEACGFSDDPQFCRGAETDEFGNYMIFGLLPTPLLPNGYRVWTGNEIYIQEFYNGTNDWSLATPVYVDPGLTTPDVDFTLKAGGSIAGIVTDTDDDPLEGFQVVACEYDGGYCMDAFSDNKGNYTITGLPESEYRVQSGSEWYVTEFFNETYDWGEAERVAVVAGGTEDGINFTLEEGGSIAGMVIDDSENPRGGVIVIACEYDGGYCMDATSASDGTYRIYAIPASDYRVEAHGEGFVIFFPGTVDPDSATPVPVVANVITENIDFKLTPD